MNSRRLKISAWLVSLFSAAILSGQAYECMFGASDETMVRNAHLNSGLPALMSYGRIEDLRLPPMWYVLDSSGNCRSWRQSGFAPVCPEDAKSEVDALMAQCGYYVQKRIGEERMLVQYVNRDGENVLWSFCPASNGQTLFSWGVSR